MYTSAQKWDNTFVECEITTMHCGNITWGRRKEEGCSLEKELCGVLPASVENLWWFFLFSGKEKGSLVVGGVSRVPFQAESTLQSSFSQKSYVCRLHHSVNALHVFLCIPFVHPHSQAPTCKPATLSPATHSHTVVMCLLHKPPMKLINLSCKVMSFIRYSHRFRRKITVCVI